MCTELFPPFSIVNKAAMNTDLQIPVQVSVAGFLAYVLGSDIAGSCGVLHLHLWQVTNCFPWQPHHVPFSSESTSAPTPHAHRCSLFSVWFFFFYSHSIRHKVISHWVGLECWWHYQQGLRTSGTPSRLRSSPGSASGQNKHSVHGVPTSKF
jgi:hypothetical protein